MSNGSKNVINIGSIGSIGGGFISGDAIDNTYGDKTIVYGSQHNSQDLAEAAAQIQEFLNQLESKGYSTYEAQQKVAVEWSNKAKSDPKVKGLLEQLVSYVREVGTRSLTGAAVVEVAKQGLRLLSDMPLP